jgi:hypothetical protein
MSDQRDARERVVIEAMARGLFVGDPESEIVTWEHATDDAKRLCYGLARQALDAALAVRDEKVCETCGNGKRCPVTIGFGTCALTMGHEGEHQSEREAEHGYGPLPGKFKDCSNGTVSGPTLLTWREDVDAALDEVEAQYPPDIFTPPPWPTEPTRDAVAAESARHTVRLIRVFLAPQETKEAEK